MFLFNRKQIQHIDTATYHADYVTAQTDHVLVDVRSASEFATGHVPDAVNIPLHELETRLNEVPTDKPVIVICASGNRSQTGARLLTQAGRTDVYNLKGGTMAWMMRNLPLEM